jgi:thiosulfate/3-mercaptopyruvate sulfurtransferase
MDTLVNTNWLSQHINDPDLVVLDCSISMQPDGSGGFKNISGRSDYEAGHIPSAGYADLFGELSDQNSTLEFALPTAEKFCEAMGALGVGDHTRVVLYDSLYSVWAARVWWMLRWVGFDQAALLDGGLKVWTSEGRPLSIEPATYPKRKLTPALRPELIADQDDVFAAIRDAEVSLIDTLPAAHYRGEVSLYSRPGHIPGASNISALDLLDPSGRYRPLDELAALHKDDRTHRTITYCGGGIAASSNAFIMTRLGFSNVAVYMASLQEWTADPTNPLVVEAS